MRFLWKRGPEFEVRWSVGGVMTNPARLILQDCPEEGLKVIWETHRNDEKVHNWVNKLVGLKKAVPGWTNLKTFATEKGWDGVTGGNIGRDENIARRLSLASTTTEEVNGVELKKLCTVRDHNWENCDKPTYAKNGCLIGKRCYKCNDVFMDRKRECKVGPTGEKEYESDVGKLFLTGRHWVQYCTTCQVALCYKCHLPFLKQQGLDLDSNKKRSPRKQLNSTVVRG